MAKDNSKKSPGNETDQGTSLKKKHTRRNLLLFGITIIIFIAIVFLSIMDTIGYEWGVFSFSILKSIFELLYFTSGIVLIIGLYIGYKQLEITNRDIRIRNERAAVDKSLDYLNFFADTLLPKEAKYSADIKKEKPLTLSDWDPEMNDYKFDVFSLEQNLQVKILEGLIVRQDCGIQDIFNHLEFFSAGIMHGLAKEDVVYDPLSGVFCKFIKKEIVALCSLRGQGSPFENLLALYLKWDLRKQNEAKLLQIKEAEHNIKLAKQQVAADEESTRPQKPIGF